MPSPRTSLISKRHHFIPRFYLRHWTGQDGRLERFSRPYNEVHVRRVTPGEVGWERSLYARPDEIVTNESHLETAFFQKLDSRAARALTSLQNAKGPTVEQARADWTFFMISLLMRTPKALETTKIKGRQIGRLGLSDQTHNKSLPSSITEEQLHEYIKGLTDHELDSSTMRLLPDFVKNERISNFIFNMQWIVIDIKESSHSLLISDEPLARTNGIANPNGHLAIPLSPRRLLLAAWHPSTLKQIISERPSKLVKAMNRWTVESARHFVVSTDRKQETFIRKWFGKDLKPALNE